MALKRKNAGGTFDVLAGAGNSGATSGHEDTTLALGTAYTPSQLTMRQVANQRLFDWPIHQRSPGLIAWEPMTGVDLTRWGRTTRTGTPTTTVDADGSVTVTSGGATSAVDFVSGHRPRILACAAEVTIKAGFTPSDIAGLEVGLYKEDGSAGLWGYYNGSGVGVFTHGTGPTAVGPSPAQPTAFTADTTQDLTLGIYLTDPTALVYIRQGNKTTYLTKVSFTLTGTASANRLPATLRDWRLGFTLSPVANKSVTVTHFAAAYMPGDSFSNPKLVTYKDGQPFTRNGKYYFLGTIHTAISFTDHSTGLYEFDPVSYRATLVSHLFGELGGNLLHLGPGQLMYDDDEDTWIWLVSTWGTNGSKSTGIDTAIGTLTSDPTTGGVFMVPLTVVPGLGAMSYYDAAARWDATAGKWRVGLIETDARTAWTLNSPALYEGATLDSLARIAGDAANSNHDGAQWAKIGGTWYLIYGSTSAFVSYSESLGSRTVLSSWSSNSPSALWGGFGGYMPHACPIAVSDEASTRYLALCYGADVQGPTSLRGSLVVLEADQKPTGWEFPRRKLLKGA